MTQPVISSDRVRPPQHAAQRLLMVILVACTLLVSGCVGSANLRSFTDPGGTYSFAYPNGMIPVELAPDQPAEVVFRDLIYATENVNLMISPFDQADRIEEVGDPQGVGHRVADKILAPEGSGRTAQLINAGQMEKDGKTYYLLEYKTQLQGQSRHDMVTVTISRHRLYTLTASTLESRWSQVRQAFYDVAQSFQVV